MAKRWTDAEYEVVSGPYRPGDKHRDRRQRRWIYTGHRDARGRPIWYRPPIFTRWGMAAVACAGFLAFQAALYVLTYLLAHH